MVECPICHKPMTQNYLNDPEPCEDCKQAEPAQGNLKSELADTLEDFMPDNPFGDERDLAENAVEAISPIINAVLAAARREEQERIKNSLGIIIESTCEGWCEGNESHRISTNDCLGCQLSAAIRESGDE